MGLLAAEMTAKLNKDPGIVYQELTDELGEHFFDRFEAPATSNQKALLKKLSPEQILSHQLAGEKIQSIITKAPGDGESIGGVKVTAKAGWFAARPSGTENIYKIYAESFLSQKHLSTILNEAQLIVNQALAKL
jgi:phosphoglucomutase